VQYYEKSRMEITDPGAVDDGLWYVTNGLLVREMVEGRRQEGHNTFVTVEPAHVNVAGDPDDPNGPTYATFAGVLNAPPLGENAPIIQRIDRNGVVTEDGSLAGYGVTAAHRETREGLDHRVASVFWDFLWAEGPIMVDDVLSEGLLFANPFYATGLPITEAYWATVRVGGTERLVLVQCFERRCLTYSPDNPEGWQIEMGNVGSHYFIWRYGYHPSWGS
jgi:hypothetical protein